MFRRRNSPLIARALLALALLVAQSGAQAHAYSHRLTDLSTAPATLCDECICFAPVLTIAGGSQHTVLVQRADREPMLASVRAPIPASRPFRAFQPRAPPAPL